MFSYLFASNWFTRQPVNWNHQFPCLYKQLVYSSTRQPVNLFYKQLVYSSTRQPVNLFYKQLVYLSTRQPVNWNHQFVFSIVGST